MRIVALLAGVAVLFAGCARQEQSTTHTGEPAPASPSPMPESPTPSSPPAAESPARAPIVATYTRSGGFAGRHEVLTIHEDGRLDFNVRGEDLVTHQIDPARVAQLKSLLEMPEFHALEGPYEARGADMITYTIAAETSQGTKTVVAMDGSDRPEHLRRVLRELSLLREAAVLQTEPR